MCVCQLTFIHYFLQLILNMKLQSTSGQSTISVVISVIGKSTDFFVTYGLNMPLEYVVMCYFSSSTTFINGFQVYYTCSAYQTICTNLASFRCRNYGSITIH